MVSLTGPLLLLLTCVVRAAVPPRSSTATLTFERGQQLRVVRNFISRRASEQLYQDLVEKATHASKNNSDLVEANTNDTEKDDDDDEEEDPVHPHLFVTKGDAGLKVPGSPSGTTVRSALNKVVMRDQADHSSPKESVVLRIELLAGNTYETTKSLINQVLPNRVLEDGGTIHLYASSPGAAALANHTDVTDIFVLQLQGVKSWFLCQENTFKARNQQVDGASDKLDRCATYDDWEIDQMLCKTLILHPGDVLFLPRRVVHSARALADQSSVHLTFGFSENQCSELDEATGKAKSNLRPRNLQGTCNAAEGGQSCDICYSNCDTNCNSGCDGGCNGSCDESCDSGCDRFCVPTIPVPYCTSTCNSGCDSGCDSCNSSCDSGCNSSCDQDCNAGCDVCEAPSSAPSGAPSISFAPTVTTIPADAPSISSTPAATPGWSQGGPTDNCFVDDYCLLSHEGAPLVVYSHNLECSHTYIGPPGNLEVVFFHTQADHDKMYFRPLQGVDSYYTFFSGYNLDGVPIVPGDVIEFSSDESIAGVGFKICVQPFAEDASTSAP